MDSSCTKENSVLTLHEVLFQKNLQYILYSSISFKDNNFKDLSASSVPLDRLYFSTKNCKPDNKFSLQNCALTLSVMIKQW